MLRNDETDWTSLARRIEAGEFHNVVISPGPGTPQRAEDVGEEGAAGRAVALASCRQACSTSPA